MSLSDHARFRRMCARFRWLAILMVTSVGFLVFATGVIVPAKVWMDSAGDHDWRQPLVSAVWGIPVVFYLFAVWSIGQAMGDLSRGRMFAATVADALRRVGVSLGLGGVFSVFVATNLLRVMDQMRGGYLHFDVPGMTLGMIGGALFLFGRVIDQAGRVQAELEEMI